MKTPPFLSKVLLSVFFLALLLMISTCSKSDEKTVVVPSLTTKTPSAITATSADVGGYVSSDGGASVTERGVCYSTSQTPTVSDFVVVEGGGTGNFQCTLSGLDPSTKYYTRAYALNSAGSGYGNQVSFTTLTAVSFPTVTTSPISNITQNSAQGGGNVTNDGGSQVTQKGVCWSTLQNPTISDNYTTDGSGMGSFTSDITGLTVSTKYYLRAYATNSTGTAYGSQISFTTTGGTGQVPTVITSSVSNITQTTASSGGNVTSQGSSSVTARGVCLSTSQNPTTSDNHTSDGSGTGNFSSSISGLSQNTPYYLRAYAINNSGTAYGNQVSFTTSGSGQVPTVTTSSITNITQNSATGGGNVTSQGSSTVTGRGVCWSTASNPTTSNNHTSDGSGTSTFMSNLINLNPNTLYYVRAYATNSVGTAYGNQLTFTTLQNVTLPTVTTTGATNISQTTATSGGNVTSDGGATVIARGVCWSTSSNPTTSNSHTSDGSGTGTFISNLSGLTPNTLYYVRAYATNSSGTAYGSQKTFSTLSNAILPTVITSTVTNITQNSATSGGNVTSDGGGTVTSRGVCWSTSSNPTVANNHTTNGSGTGTFISNLTGLTPSTLYYIRAYATNNIGTAYGGEENFTTLGTSVQPCPGMPTITIIHVAGAVAPVNKTVTYGTVTNIPGEPTKCWITSNLGADHQATTVDDATEASAGWYWQFNLKQGFKHDGTTRTPSTSWISTLSGNIDWIITKDPCALELGSGWRIPTMTEWTNVDASGIWNNWNGPWNSGLKLHAAGDLAFTDGSLYYRGSSGCYWSSTQYNTTYSGSLNFASGYSVINTSYLKAFGFTLRCLKD